MGNMKGKKQRTRIKNNTKEDDMELEDNQEKENRRSYQKMKPRTLSKRRTRYIDGKMCSKRCKDLEECYGK